MEIIYNFFRFIIFHKWNKLTIEHINFLNKSGYNPNGLNLKLFNYIKKINKL